MRDYVSYEEYKARRKKQKLIKATLPNSSQYVGPITKLPPATECPKLGWNNPRLTNRRGSTK